MSNGSPQFIFTKYLRIVADVAGLNHVLVHLFQNQFSSVFSGFRSGFFGFWKLLELVRFWSCQRRQKNRTGPDFKALIYLSYLIVVKHEAKFWQEAMAWARPSRSQAKAKPRLAGIRNSWFSDHPYLIWTFWRTSGKWKFRRTAESSNFS